jgi:hypothetical protein
MADGDWLRQFTQEDYAASLIRVTLGLTGPLGVIAAEFLTQFVPRQRLDRLSDFLEKLVERVSDLEAFKSRLQESAAFSAVVEQAFIVAVRTPSTERRRDLASLLRNGLSRPDAEMIEQQTFVRMLDELNDPEVLILMNYGSFSVLINDPARLINNPARDEFRRTHATVFDVRPPTLGDSDPSSSRRWTMYQSYVSHLVRLDLAEEYLVGTPRNEAERLRQPGITPLGRMLLASIDRLVTETPR